MLKITHHTDGTSPVLEIEGRLAGPWVKELESYWRQVINTSSQPQRLLLTAVTFIDDAGKDLLAAMYQQGTELVAKGCMTKAIVDEIMQGEHNQEKRS